MVHLPLKCFQIAHIFIRFPLTDVTVKLNQRVIEYMTGRCCLRQKTPHIVQFFPFSTSRKMLLDKDVVHLKNKVICSTEMIRHKCKKRFSFPDSPLKDLSRLQRGTRGPIQSDTIITQITNHTPRFITLLLRYSTTRLLQIAWISLPNTAMKCNLSSLEEKKRVKPKLITIASVNFGIFVL